jgi:protein-S-isoprenylcysteine O-methyltransferase Ste14
MNFGIIIIVVSILWVGSEITLSKIKHSQSTDTRFDKSSLSILWVTIAIFTSIGVLFGFQQTGYFGNGSYLFPIAGLVCIVIGLLIRWIAIFSLKRQFTVDVSITQDHRIIRSGIYRFVRHPSYSGSLLSFFGLGLYFTNYISMLIIFVPICLAFLYRIHIEEKALISNFGDEYIKYCASTKRLIPGVF